VSSFFSHRMPNGLTIVGEQLLSVSSVAVTLLIPAGAATDPIGSEGAMLVLSEMLNKGTARYNSKELSEEFENIGAHKSSFVGNDYSVFYGSMLSENLGKFLELFSEVILKPALPAAELESVVAVALQELNALEDEPASKVLVDLAARFYPKPFNRCLLGTQSGLTSLTIDKLKENYQRTFSPDGAIIGVAGSFDWDEVKNTVEKLFGQWSGERLKIDVQPNPDKDTTTKITRDTNQVQIALAYPSVSKEHVDYYTAMVGVGVLSSGFASRLFIEVREKRGLVYRVSASHSAIKGRAAVFGYAGTTPEKADETLQVMLTEHRRLKDGVTDDELKRTKADIKSRIIMAQESSSSRAQAIVHDMWSLGRVREIEEIKAEIDKVTSADITRHLESYPVDPYTLVIMGK